MREITGQEAATRYGVTAHHEEMNNGECRFRLLKTDGTAYVRTESGPLGAWQDSHDHNGVKETYIVQKGWMAYATLMADELDIRILGAGEMLTTPLRVAHNVYLPAGAVIHTVKHGDAAIQDRKVNDGTRRLDEATKCLSEDQIRFEAEKSAHQKTSETYTAEYRHFDTLIWQLPVWCTAIFAATALGTNSIQQATFITDATGLTKKTIATSFLILMSLVLLALGHALYRFRRHQTKIKRYPKISIWSSASTYLQMIVTLQAVTLLFLVLLMNGLRLRLAFWGGGLILVLLTIYREYGLRRGTSTTV